MINKKFTRIVASALSVLMCASSIGIAGSVMPFSLTAGAYYSYTDEDYENMHLMAASVEAELTERYKDVDFGAVTYLQGEYIQITGTLDGIETATDKSVVLRAYKIRDEIKEYLGKVGLSDIRMSIGLSWNVKMNDIETHSSPSDDLDYSDVERIFSLKDTISEKVSIDSLYITPAGVLFFSDAFVAPDFDRQAAISNIESFIDTSKAAILICSESDLVSEDSPFSYYVGTLLRLYNDYYGYSPADMGTYALEACKEFYDKYKDYTLEQIEEVCAALEDEAHLSDHYKIHNSSELHIDEDASGYTYSGLWGDEDGYFNDGDIILHTYSGGKCMVETVRVTCFKDYPEYSELEISYYCGEDDTSVLDLYNKRKLKVTDMPDDLFKEDYRDSEYLRDYYTTIPLSAVKNFDEAVFNDWINNFRNNNEPSFPFEIDWDAARATLKEWGAISEAQDAAREKKEQEEKARQQALMDDRSLIADIAISDDADDIIIYHYDFIEEIEAYQSGIYVALRNFGTDWDYKSTTEIFSNLRVLPADVFEKDKNKELSRHSFAYEYFIPSDLLVNYDIESFKKWATSCNDGDIQDLPFSINIDAAKAYINMLLDCRKPKSAGVTLDAGYTKVTAYPDDIYEVSDGYGHIVYRMPVKYELLEDIMAGETIDLTRNIIFKSSVPDFTYDLYDEDGADRGNSLYLDGYFWVQADAFPNGTYYIASTKGHTLTSSGLSANVSDRVAFTIGDSALNDNTEAVFAKIKEFDSAITSINISPATEEYSGRQVDFVIDVDVDSGAGVFAKDYALLDTDTEYKLAVIDKLEKIYDYAERELQKAGFDNVTYSMEYALDVHISLNGQDLHVIYPHSTSEALDTLMAQVETYKDSIARVTFDKDMGTEHWVYVYVAFNPTVSSDDADSIIDALESTAKGYDWHIFTDGCLNPVTGYSDSDIWEAVFDLSSALESNPDRSYAIIALNVSQADNLIEFYIADSIDAKACAEEILSYIIEHADEIHAPEGISIRVYYTAYYVNDFSDMTEVPYVEEVVTSKPTAKNDQATVTMYDVPDADANLITSKDIAQSVSSNTTATTSTVTASKTNTTKWEDAPKTVETSYAGLIALFGALGAIAFATTGTIIYFKKNNVP